MTNYLQSIEYLHFKYDEPKMAIAYDYMKLVIAILSYNSKS